MKIRKKWGKCFQSGWNGLGKDKIDLQVDSQCLDSLFGVGAYPIDKGGLFWLEFLL